MQSKLKAQSGKLKDKRFSYPSQMREKASERKLYHSDENQTPPNLPLLRGGIDQVSPLYKGGLRGVCGSTFTLSSAFTLVELIVVITILAILGTVSFISFQGFVTDARDVKRITDIKNLIEKINIETTKGVLLENLMIREGKVQTGITINGTGATTNIGIINFENLKENQESFQDPLSKEDYKFAFAEGITEVNGKEEGYNFIQLQTISEKTNKIKLVGNYFEYKEGDSPSLFKIGNKYLVDGGSVDGVLSRYPGCDTDDITIGSYTIAACNVGANIAGIHTGCTEDGNDAVNLLTTNTNCRPEYVGYHFQWGRNKGFSQLETSDKPSKQSTQIPGAIGLNASADNYGFVRGSSLLYYAWASDNIDNNWGGEGDDYSTTGNNKARQGPCANGYHVPSTAEWRGLVEVWFASKSQTCIVSDEVSYGCNWILDANYDNFQNDLLLPPAGSRNPTNTQLSYQGFNGHYWSSSPNGVYVWRMRFTTDQIHPAYGYGLGRTNGFSVRCFKN